MEKEYILKRQVFDWKGCILFFSGAFAFAGLTFLGYMTGYHFISGICSVVSFLLFIAAGDSASDRTAKEETIRLEEVKK